MKTISFYRLILYVVMVFFVVVFQSYWLYDNYGIQKNHLLKDIENKVQKQTLTLTLRQLAGSIRIIGENDSIYMDLASAVKQGPSDINDTLPKMSSQNLQEYSKLSSISLTLTNLSTLFGDNNYDSVLYYFLSNNMPELGGTKGENIIVYHQFQNEFISYPRGKRFIYQNNTEPILAKLNFGSTFQVHIRHLNLIVLHKMYGAFVFSLFYQLLFIATMIFIIRTDKQSKKLLESKTNFTNNMTHELKIPISTLYLATESLDKYSRQDDPKEVRRHVSIIYEGLHQLSNIVDKILTSARLQQQHVSIHREPVNVRLLIDEVIKSMHLQLEHRKAVVDVSGIPDNAYIYADHEQMQHVFFNLIDNAIKYTTTDPLIKIVTKKQRNKQIIQLIDNGKGMPIKYFREIFQPYFRIPEQDVHNVMGYGLGLSFVLQVIHLHKGSIRVAYSVEGEGTIMEIKLTMYDV